MASGKATVTTLAGGVWLASPSSLLLVAIFEMPGMFTAAPLGFVMLTRETIELPEVNVRVVDATSATCTAPLGAGVAGADVGDPDVGLDGVARLHHGRQVEADGPQLGQRRLDRHGDRLADGCGRGSSGRRVGRVGLQREVDPAAVGRGTRRAGSAG